MKENVRLVVLGFVVCMFVLSCNDGMSSVRNREEPMAKKDRSQRTVIDSAEYVDFTVEKNNANAVKMEDFMFTLNNGVFKNGNSIIKIKSQEKTIEISSDSGIYNGKNNCQVLGKYSIDIKAASNDCLYIRKDPKQDGFVMIDGVMFRNEAMPDLLVCLPLYGYSRNRMELSNIMDGFIVMPSGTYWRQ